MMLNPLGKTGRRDAAPVDKDEAVFDDPPLRPFRLKHRAFRDRLPFTAHEPACIVEGMPKDRARHSHAEKAKGAIALTMIGGPAVAASAIVRAGRFTIRFRIAPPIRG